MQKTKVYEEQPRQQRNLIPKRITESIDLRSKGDINWKMRNKSKLELPDNRDVVPKEKVVR